MMGVSVSEILKTLCGWMYVDFQNWDQEGSLTSGNEVAVNAFIAYAEGT
jgi:hypothetical protein